MIKTRAEILSQNPVFTILLIGIQKAKHQIGNEYSVGSKVILDDSNNAVTLTKELSEKLIKEETEYFEKNKDSSPFELASSDKFIEGKKFVSGKQDPQEYMVDIAQSLEDLRIHLRQNHLLLLGDWPSPWLGQANDYPPVKEALEYLRGIIDESFVGGFSLRETELMTFIPHLFWLTRCNMSLPLVLMAFEDSKTIFFLCKHGVLHFEFYDVDERDSIQAFFQARDFRVLQECEDPIFFDKFEGRRLDMS